MHALIDRSVKYIHICMHIYMCGGVDLYIVNCMVDSSTGMLRYQCIPFLFTRLRWCQGPCLCACLSCLNLFICVYMTTRACTRCPQTNHPLAHPLTDARTLFMHLCLCLALHDISHSNDDEQRVEIIHKKRNVNAYGHPFSKPLSRSPLADQRLFQDLTFTKTDRPLTQYRAKMYNNRVSGSRRGISVSYTYGYSCVCADRRVKLRT